MRRRRHTYNGIFLIVLAYVVLLADNNYIQGITCKVYEKIKVKWLHTVCPSPWSRADSPFIAPGRPSPCEVHIEVWQETVDKRHMLDFISTESSHGLWVKNDCHFYPIYSSACLAVHFLCRKFALLKYHCLSCRFPCFVEEICDGSLCTDRHLTHCNKHLRWQWIIQERLEEKTLKGVWRRLWRVYCTVCAQRRGFNRYTEDRYLYH